MCSELWYVCGMAKVQTSVRMTPKAKEMISLIAEKLGISQGSVLELAIRKMHKEVTRGR